MEYNIIQIVILPGGKITHIPYQVSRAEISSIAPLITSKGRMYKNVSVIEKIDGQTMNVVGNYKDLRRMVRQSTHKTVRGFKRH